MDVWLTPLGSSSPSSSRHPHGDFLDADDGTGLAVGHAQEVSRTSRDFSPSKRAAGCSSEVSSVSPFGVTLTDQDVAGLDLGADAG